MTGYLGDNAGDTPISSGRASPDGQSSRVTFDTPTWSLIQFFGGPDVRHYQSALPGPEPAPDGGKTDGGKTDGGKARSPRRETSTAPGVKVAAWSQFATPFPPA
jgi:hypothetical protein